MDLYSASDPCCKPENNEEDVETGDGPIVVDTCPAMGCEEDVEDYENCCAGLLLRYVVLLVVRYDNLEWRIRRETRSTYDE